MRDVDALDGLLASAAAPVLTTAAVGLAGIAVTATLSSYAAIVLGIGVVAVAGFAWRAGSRVPDPAELRASARGRIIAVGEALPELVSLGAADVAAQEAQRRLAGFTAQEATRGLRLAAAGTWAGVLSGVTVLAALGPVRSGGTTDVATVALIALLAAGTLQLVEGFGAAAAAATEATRAARRLRTEEAAPGAREAPAENDLAATELRVPGAHSLDLAVKAGGTLVISGRSGAGKTTLLRQLAGEAVADVVIGGVPTDRLRPGHLVSVAVDDPLIGADVLANLRLGAPQLSEEEARALLDDFGLTDVLLDDTVGAGGARALSGGEQRRLTIARAVAAAPRVLLLDEPTDGLDPDTATRTLRAIREHLPATTVVAAIHDRDLRLVPWADTRLMSLDDRQRKAAPENASRVRPSPQTGQRAV
nr:ATP-binding cassette domain-containing protein [Flexivirga meconopsidis]